MQVKKFEAPTIQEALDNIKRELGPEAIILQTKKNKRGFGLMSKSSVEITAAVSDRSLGKKKFAETRIPEATQAAVKKLTAEKQADLYEKYLEEQAMRGDRVQVSRQARAAKTTPQGRNPAPARTQRYIDIEDDPQITATRPKAVPPKGPATGAVAAPMGSQGMTVHEEMKHLKRMVEEMKTTQEKDAHGSGAQAMLAQAAINTPVLEGLFEQLIVNGLDKRYALSLIKKVAFELGPEASKNPENTLDQLASEIMAGIKISSTLSRVAEQRLSPGPTVVALVGPTGVGKTTTVAKMASEALLRRNLKVGLINLDSYKVAAFDQLGTYAKILNVPFRSAASAEDVQAAISDFQSLDLVIVDTTGRSQRDPESLKQMRDLLIGIQGLSVQLVLAVTTRDTELYDMANRFAIFAPQSVIISKLDEATIYGAIYNLSQKTNLPFSYFTTGQRVPEDIEEATSERVASLILDL